MISKLAIEFFGVSFFAKIIDPKDRNKQGLTFRVFPTTTESNRAVISALDFFTELNADHVSRFKFGLTVLKMLLIDFSKSQKL